MSNLRRRIEKLEGNHGPRRKPVHVILRVKRDRSPIGTSDDFGAGPSEKPRPNPAPKIDWQGQEFGSVPGDEITVVREPERQPTSEKDGGNSHE